MYGDAAKRKLIVPKKKPLLTRRAALIGLGAAIAAPAIIKTHSSYAWGSHGTVPVPSWATHKTTKIYDNFSSSATIDTGDTRQAGKLWYPANNWECPIIGSPPISPWWGRTSDPWHMVPTPNNGLYYNVANSVLDLPQGNFVGSDGFGFSMNLNSVALNSGASGGYVGWTLGGTSTSGFSLSFLSRFDQSKANGNESPGLWSFGGIDFLLGLTPLTTEIDFQEVFGNDTPQSIHDWNFNYAYDPTVGSNFNPYNTTTHNPSAFGWCEWGFELNRNGDGTGSALWYRNNVQTARFDYLTNFLPLLDSQKWVIMIQAAQLAGYQLEYFWAGET